MEVAMLLGLAALGYSLAQKPAMAEGAMQMGGSRTGPKDPIETYVNADDLPDVTTDGVRVLQDMTGHNNMVPYYGAKITQALYSGATEGILDSYTGAGKNHRPKEEAPSFYDTAPGTGLPFGKQVETDFEQSRMVTSMALKNVFPVERTLVGPGVNDGYTNLPSGGFQQDAMREYALPKTTDELRTENKPKVTYEGVTVPGAHYITNMGIQAPVKKNRPDRFQVLGPDRLNTTTGQQMASAIYPSQIMKAQAREETSVMQIGGAQAAAGGFLSYVRAFTEPFQEFMKLTVEGRPNGGIAQQGGVAAGPQSVNVAVRKDEDVFNNTRGFEAPLYGVGGQIPTSDLQGSVKHFEPLQQDINMERNSSDLLEAFKSNPYTHSLSSAA